MSTIIYITRISLTDSDAPGEAWYIPSVDGQRIVAGRSPAGRPRWFMSLDAAAEALWPLLPDDVVSIGWEPQYDSAWAEAADEPCGYVGKAVTR